MNHSVYIAVFLLLLGIADLVGADKSRPISKESDLLLEAIKGHEAELEAVKKEIELRGALKRIPNLIERYSPQNISTLNPAYEELGDRVLNSHKDDLTKSIESNKSQLVETLNRQTEIDAKVIQLPRNTNKQEQQSSEFMQENNNGAPGKKKSDCSREIIKEHEERLEAIHEEIKKRSEPTSLTTESSSLLNPDYENFNDHELTELADEQSRLLERSKKQLMKDLEQEAKMDIKVAKNIDEQEKQEQDMQYLALTRVILPLVTIALLSVGYRLYKNYQRKKSTNLAAR